MSAVLERERRVTAGKRMTFLAGQELENDEAFWTHDTWQEDNESFHSSDAASSAEEDVFDSDFDESENDDEVIANEEMLGAAMEREIEQEERDSNNKKRHSAYTEVSNNKFGTKKKAFGPNGRKPPRTGPNGKRVVGDGLNAGIVLNVPPQYQKIYVPSRPPLLLSSTAPRNTPLHQPIILLSNPSIALPPESLTTTNTDSTTIQVNLHADSTNTATGTHVPPTTQSQTSLLDATVSSFELHPTSTKKKVSKPTLAATRIRRSSHENTMVSGGVRSRKSTKSIEKSDTEKTTPAPNGLKRGKQAFTQEQLLLEAVQETEPENERWILGQKRNQAMKDDIETQLRSNQSADKNTKAIERFVSRRGYYNTITFLDMDHIPYILQRRRSLSSSSCVEPVARPQCIITGKVAKFRDPQTGHGYHDVEAFRELRRRYEANELPALSTIHTTDVASTKDSVRMEALPVSDTTGRTTATASEGSTKMKPQKRSRSMPDKAGTKRATATSRRASNGKKRKEASTSKSNGKREDVLIPQMDTSSPSTRPRTTSTGGESINSLMKLHSAVYDYETISHSNHSRDNPRTHTNGTAASAPLSPPLSPGRKSPRVPKPTMKLLESARAAAIPSLMLQHPLIEHPPQQSFNTLDDDDAATTKSNAFATTQPTSEYVKN